MMSGVVMSTLLGSPPRMRGTHLHYDNGRYDNRITPAHAGNTGEVLTIHRIVQDHPRACGEHLLHRSRQHFITGSPPRMRGTL